MSVRSTRFLQVHHMGRMMLIGWFHREAVRMQQVALWVADLLQRCRATSRAEVAYCWPCMPLSGTACSCEYEHSGGHTWKAGFAAWNARSYRNRRLLQHLDESPGFDASALLILAAPPP